MTKGCLAVTGGTGFVGSTLIQLAVEAGWTVRALARQPQEALSGVEWIAGALDEPATLERLLEGAMAVIHVAGVTNAPTKEAFAQGNIGGTETILAASVASNIQRFIHVSSLTARAPGLSNYGWSKSEAEKRVLESNLAWTIVRPPAVFGPGDHDHLDLFKAARFHIMPLPPAGKESVIEVSDLGHALLAVATAQEAIGQVYEVDDGRVGGWTHAEFSRAIGAAMGKWVFPLPVPAPLVFLGARLDRALRGSHAKLTQDRASYFCHPDWVIDPAKRPSEGIWLPLVDTKQGLADTAAAYRAAGWL